MHTHHMHTGLSKQLIWTLYSSFSQHASERISTLNIDIVAVFLHELSACDLLVYRCDCRSGALMYLCCVGNDQDGSFLDPAVDQYQ